jgi:hypothetical protein
VFLQQQRETVLRFRIGEFIEMGESFCFILIRGVLSSCRLSSAGSPQCTNSFSAMHRATRIFFILVSRRVFEIRLATTARPRRRRAMAPARASADTIVLPARRRRGSSSVPPVRTAWRASPRCRRRAAWPATFARPACRRLSAMASVCREPTAPPVPAQRQARGRVRRATIATRAMTGRFVRQAR